MVKKDRKKKSEKKLKYQKDSKKDEEEITLEKQTINKDEEENLEEVIKEEIIEEIVSPSYQAEDMAYKKGYSDNKEGYKLEDKGNKKSEYIPLNQEQRFMDNIEEQTKPHTAQKDNIYDGSHKVEEKTRRYITQK